MREKGPRDLRNLEAMVRRLDPEARVRLRHWISESFDGCGRPRASASEAKPFRAFVVADFEHTNIREYRPPGRLRYRRSPPDSGGIYAIASDRDWLYVGRAKSLAARRNDHASTLRHGSHPNVLLQHHWSGDDEAVWFVILERWSGAVSLRRGGEHCEELKWKRLLRPLYDREARRADISFFIQPENASPSCTWPGGPPTAPRSTSKVCGLPS